MSAAQTSHCIDRDPTPAHVRKYLMRGWPEHCRIDELSEQDGGVLWGARVVIPP